MLKLRDAVFTLFRARHRAAEQVGKQLGTVTDTQHGQAQLKNTRVRMGRAVLMHAGRTTAQNDPRRGHLSKCFRRDRVGDNDAVYLRFTYPARNQFTVLCAKIQHNHRFPNTFHKNDPFIRPC